MSIIDRDKMPPDPTNPGDGPGEFYIGYEPRVPKPYARVVRRAVAIIALLAIPVAAVVASRQQHFDSGRFEFGTLRTFEGVLYETPFPTLRVTEPGRTPQAPAVTNYVLVGAGKHSIPPEARGHDGQKVRFQGSLVYRQGMTMVEMNDPQSFAVLGAPSPAEERGRAESLGPVHLVGEVVDTKCFFGVMRPATGKVHRACAIRCLSGGVPPGLWVHDGKGQDQVFLLAGPEGKTLNLDVQLAGLTVDAQGTAEMLDGVPVLRVERIERQAGQ